MTNHLTNKQRSTGKEIFLHPGEFHFGGSDEHMGTLLGSCIAIVLWHPILKIGGMCHFVLPKRSGASTFIPDGRYAVEAMELFKSSARKRNTTMKEYHGMIYGGGNIVAALAKENEDTIGMRNAGIAMELLQQYKVAIMIADVGETWSRRIRFDVATGQVDVKHGRDISSPR